MPLTPEQIDQLNIDIELAARAAGPFVSLLGPQATAGLILGAALARLVPGTIAIVQGWVAGAEPTPEEKAITAAELAVLGNPDLP